MPGRSERSRVAYLGLGGNIGNPRRQMAQAIALLDAHPEIAVEAVSALYATPPWGKLDQPDFLNAALRISTRLNANSLLEVCLETEKALLRERRERWGPRLIDIDILLIEGEVVEEQDLQIPHLRLQERLFALLPLRDVAGDVILRDKPLSGWISSLDGEGIRRDDNLDWWREEN
ncbi:2-amino-4-hydroxy-6-hydroxymethyldihydropteridine diphosphokinase [Limoniibacter endophyticus]|uniref:2-amino-4-hydroxy-6-hydroxymethyldihydropteridine pyrophosphokinase n=1 Tax=Limoniibacter endophyticus TaxID=1565040 RepID=A0A8J3DJ75_9HYPH|nr:2-amino-4-hydroxy-6-hydroxymethyldihydropteridine diphosphokinase [Limoniibacter endophyticus]GHC60495.1 2-amino-4-hydroxy-6-hydroxymethyldihydropteridine diphosphokinase [Limoniibacter endophyticus]